MSMQSSKRTKTIHEIQCRNFRHFDNVKFQADVEKIDWDSLYICGDVNICVHLFHMLLKYVTKMLQYRLLKLHERAPPWLNTSYLDAVDNREHWSQKFNKNPCDYHLIKN